MVTLSATKTQQTVSDLSPPTDETSVDCSTSNQAASTNPRGSKKTYLVRFQGNNSKKWDGHDVELDGEWLESLYDVSELKNPGKQLSLPWPGKGKQIRQWNAVISTPRGTESDDPAGEKPQPTKKKSRKPQ